MSMDLESADTYMGLDLSTQQLKAIVINDKLDILHQAAVNFDSDLPEFRTHGGVIQNKNDTHIVTTPTLLWVKALDMLMDRLTVAGVDFAQIAAISGTAQQHGSVFWQKGAEEKLKNLDESQFLHQQLAVGCFSLPDSPVWMDSSTTEECGILETTAGGPEKLAELTGSKAYERFTGSQIMKIARTKPEIYNNTERISLVSSFLASLFLGRIAEIDIADGSGMNLLNIRTKEWDEKLLEVCGGDGLKQKLGRSVKSDEILGNVSKYYADRWDFRNDCKIIGFTGDNPASLIGMRLNEDWISISLGTSDTIFMWLKEPKVVADGHVLCNPVDSNAYMALLCFKNGSLTREKIRNDFADGSWEIFDQLLESTPRGNFGNLGLYYLVQEIVPFVNGVHRFNKADDKVVKFPSLEMEIRALVEGQFLARRAHAEEFGFKIDSNTKILATGGASKNKSLLQVLSDVFNAPVFIQETADSAVLGAAYQAIRGVKPGSSTVDAAPSIKLCEPFKDAERIYGPMVERYRKTVKDLIAK